MEKGRSFRLGMGQMLVEGGARGANLARAACMVREAADQGCAAVVLPECLDTGWTHPSALALAQPIPGASSDGLARAAADARVHLVAGLTERDGNSVYNTAVLISPGGELLLKHRKINILSVARHLYDIGDRLAVARTPLGTMGVNVCADNFPNSLVLGHSLARMGARIILSPCAWAVDGDHDNRAEPYGGVWRTAYGELARLYDLWVVGVSNVGWISDGPWRGRKCIGCSLAMGPGGNVAAEGAYGADAHGLVLVDVDLMALDAEGTVLTDRLREAGYDGP